MSRKPPKVTNAPGITWHKRKDGQWKAVWRARTDLIKKGYKFKSIGVWVGTPEELDANNIHWIQTRANDLQIDMLAWGRGEVPRVAGFFDGTIEALAHAYRTDQDRLPDNSLYWNSVLIAKGGFIPKTTLQGPYAVALVALNDVLNIRSGAGVSNPIVGTFPPDATNIMRTGSTTMVDGAAWDEVIMPDGVAKGWVNSYYLTEYISRETFCVDAHIAPLIDQLKQAMNQSDGTQFSSLVSRKHGMNVNYWLHGTTVNYTSLAAQTAFTDSQAINWGGGPSGNPDNGTFAQKKRQTLDLLFAELQQNMRLKLFILQNVKNLRVK